MPLANVGHRVGRSLIGQILKAAVLPPAPQCPTSWQNVLKAPWGAIATADFFTTEVRTWRGLVTYYTVFVTDLASLPCRSSDPRRIPRSYSGRKSRTLTMVGFGAVPTPDVLMGDRDRK